MRIGIDMGGMSIKFGLVNDENRIIAKAAIPTELDITPQELIRKMGEAVLQLLSDNHLSVSDCRGIGIGSPGTIDDVSGKILYSNNFHWENVALKEELKKTVDTGIALANDADAAALGEVCAGAAAGSENAVLITLGTGVGGGVILNGKIFHGPLAGGCELGHMVIAAGGEPCSCGRKGCLEAYASAAALIRMAKEEAEKHPDSIMHRMCAGNLSNMNGKIPFDAAMEKDAAAVAVIDRYEDYLACGIANIINIFRPEKIILGGGIAWQRENLTVPLTRKTADLCFGGAYGEIPEIVTSELGNDAGIVGAANLID